MPLAEWPQSGVGPFPAGHHRPAVQGRPWAGWSGRASSRLSPPAPSRRTQGWGSGRQGPVLPAQTHPVGHRLGHLTGRRLRLRDSLFRGHWGCGARRGSTWPAAPVPPAQGEAVSSLQGAFCPPRPGSPPLDEAPRFQSGPPFLTEAQGCGSL